MLHIYSFQLFLLHGYCRCYKFYFDYRRMWYLMAIYFSGGEIRVEAVLKCLCLFCNPDCCLIILNYKQRTTGTIHNIQYIVVLWAHFANTQDVNYFLSFYYANYCRIAIEENELHKKMQKCCVVLLQTNTEIYYTTK